LRTASDPNAAIDHIIVIFHYFHQKRYKCIIPLKRNGMMKAPVLMFAVLAALGMTKKKTEAHGCAGSCWGGCRSSQECALPRRHHDYDYLRRRRDAIDLASDIFSMPLYTNILFRQDQLARMDCLAPRYAIDETEDGMMVELTMQVPGVAAKDMTVEVVDGNVLWVRGSQTIRGNGSLMMQSEFDQSFQLDKDIDVENISVTLSSGILRVSAPKKARVTKNIPIEIHEEEEIEREELDLAKDETLKSPEGTKEGGVTVDALTPSRDGLVIMEEEDS
jgi:HSP20 family molecular chaperone IbpA